jgi:hypothetical protein
MSMVLIYRTVLISPRYVNFIDPLAVCREQFTYLSYKGLASSHHNKLINFN